MQVIFLPASSLSPCRRTNTKHLFLLILQLKYSRICTTGPGLFTASSTTIRFHSFHPLWQTVFSEQPRVKISSDPSEVICAVKLKKNNNTDQYPCQHACPIRCSSVPHYQFARRLRTKNTYGFNFIKYKYKHAMFASLSMNRRQEYSLHMAQSCL